MGDSEIYLTGVNLPSLGLWISMSMDESRFFAERRKTLHTVSVFLWFP